MEDILVVGDGDVREENRQLAIKMLMRELRNLKNDEVDKIMKRWDLREIEQGNTLSLGIDFPSDVERYQWIYENGEAKLQHIIPSKSIE